MQRDRRTCRYCGAPATELDHVHPYSRRGLTTAANLVAACSSCNKSKGDRTPEEWRRAQALKRALSGRTTRRAQIKANISAHPRRAPSPVLPGYLADLLRG
jgi:5-methylcytosine-specific restriction endonuclease McrA